MDKISAPFCTVLLSLCLHLSTGSAQIIVGYEQVKYQFSESSGSPQVCLKVDGNASSSFVVTVATHEGIADESDYSPFYRNITITEGLPRVCFAIPIIDDRKVEDNETFTLSVHEPRGGLPSEISINATSNGTAIKIVDNDRLLNCRSFLRFIRPNLFQHCYPRLCTYSDFTSWKPVPGTKVPAPLGICESGEAQTTQRSQEAPEPGCKVKVERRQQCVLLDAERLIQTFNLNLPRPSQPTFFESGLTRSLTNSVSAVAIGGFAGGGLSASTNTRDNESPPKECNTPRNMCGSIDWDRYKNNWDVPAKVCEDQPACAPNHGNICKLRTLVIVLDISGSVTEENVELMLNATGDLVPLFCDNMQLAILTYNQAIEVEFCFDCYKLCREQYCGERILASEAIKDIQYRDGGFTHTGEAIRCVYDYLLDPDSCGVDPTSDCLDIIYITDGMSNGPLRYPKSCVENTCLRNHPDWCGRVNTYAIAIGSYVNRDEIKCLTLNDENSVFNVKDFEELENLVQNAIHLLNTSSHDTECINHTDRAILLE